MAREALFERLVDPENLSFVFCINTMDTRCLDYVGNEIFETTDY